MGKSYIKYFYISLLLLTWANSFNWIERTATDGKVESSNLSWPTKNKKFFLKFVLQLSDIFIAKNIDVGHQTKLQHVLLMFDNLIISFLFQIVSRKS